MSYPINQPITYTAVASTQGAPSNAFTYAWAFDDGGTANTASATHTWTTTGNHLATVTATDTTTGGTATASKTISIMSYLWILLGQTAGTGPTGNGVYGVQGTKLLIAPGTTSTSTLVYDFSNNTFSAGPTLNAAFNPGVDYGSGVFAPAPIRTTDGKIYLQQGGSVAPMLVDLVGNTVTNLTAQTFSTFTTPLAVQGSDGLVYYFGMSGTFDQTYVHDPVADSWVHKASSAPTAIVGSRPISIGNNKFFTISRQTGRGYVYDATADSWTTSTNACGLSLGSSASYTSILIGNLVYSFGTDTLGNKLGSIYNIATNTFTNTSADTIYRISPGLYAMENGKIHIICGSITSATSVIYDPVSNTYSNTYAMSNASMSNALIHPTTGKPFAFGAASSAPMYANTFDGT